MLKRYHTINSVCTQELRIQFAEMALDWMSRLMTPRGDQLDDAYLKPNPNGVVSTPIHDGSPFYAAR
jgi:hypothetical protein